MTSIIEVNDENFDQEVSSYNQLVLLDFSSSWCGPCKKQYPILEKLLERNSDKIKICKVDIDDSPKATKKFLIRSVPTLVFLLKNNVIKTYIGLTNLNDLELIVQQY